MAPLISICPTCTAAAVLFWPTSLAAGAVITDNPILTGIICVAGSEAMTAITSAGGRAVRRADSDRSCRDPGQPFAIAVPEGLEGWTIKILTKLGYRAGFTETRECKVMAPTKVL